MGKVLMDADDPEYPIDICPCAGPGRPVHVKLAGASGDILAVTTEYLPPWCSQHNPKEPTHG